MNKSDNLLVCSGTNTTVTVTWNPSATSGVTQDGTITVGVQLPGLSKPVPITKTITVGTVPNYHNIRSLFYQDYVPFSPCTFEDVITYNGVVAAAGNSYGITGGQWRAKAPDYHVALVGLVPPSSYNAVLNAAVTLQAFRVSPYDNRAHIEARLKNRCGWSDWADIEYFCKTCLGNPGGGGGIWFSYSPNPVADELTVNFEITQDTTDQPLEVMVRLLDNQGQIQRQTQLKHRRGESKEEVVKFKLSSLREGTYYLHIEGNGEMYKEQIVVKRN